MEKEQHLQTLSDIKNLMERSSRFISLSGLSGVSAGIIALGGAIIAYPMIEEFNTMCCPEHPPAPEMFTGFALRMILLAIATFVLAIIAGSLFTMRRAKKNDVPAWNSSSKKLLINLLIPIVAGGAFIIMMLYYGDARFVAPASLLFYGLALVNASKYTLTDIRYLGICEIILGVINMFFIGQGLIFWAIGFGIFHILYGMLMYFKYER